LVLVRLVPFFMEELKMVLSELRKTEHLSASSIGTYVECSLMYKFAEIDHIPMEQKSDAMEFGQLFILPWNIIIGKR